MFKRKLVVSLALIVAFTGFALSAWGDTFTLKNGMAPEDGNIVGPVVSSNAGPHQFGTIPPGGSESYDGGQADWQGRRLTWGHLEAWTSWPAQYGCPSGKDWYDINRGGNVTVTVTRDGCHFKFAQ
ncbi:MAG: hypothetical protein M0009_03550 [Deltaproteobacteria bacterium]|nr:hypothetical protein [Deltaproteobacteria bacterium]